MNHNSMNMKLVPLGPLVEKILWDGRETILNVFSRDQNVREPDDLDNW